jgi:hypothetical protein
MAEHQQRPEDEHDEAAPRRDQREGGPGAVDPRREWTDPEFDEAPEEEPPDQRERGDIGF